MKALSITRPWPELILRHGKNVENRTWWTSYRGPLLVHAAKSWQGTGILIAEALGVEGVSWSPADHPVGIVGLVDLVDICSAHAGYQVRDCDCGPWAAHGQCHWRLANPRPFSAPIPCPGALQLWTPPEAVAVAVAAAIGGDL